MKNKMNTITIIQHHGNVNEGVEQRVRLYESGETRGEVMIDLNNELEAGGGYEICEEILGSGSYKYDAPDGYGLVCMGAKTRTLNERGNPVCRTISILAAYKL